MCKQEGLVSRAVKLDCKSEGEHSIQRLQPTLIRVSCEPALAGAQVRGSCLLAIAAQEKEVGIAELPVVCVCDPQPLLL